MVIWLLVIMIGHAPVTGAAGVFASALIGVNTISLMFDFKDAVDWRRGDRGPAGRNVT